MDVHPHQKDDPFPSRPHQILGSAVRELLIQKGIYTLEEERSKIEEMQVGSPALGAKIVARAWMDEDFLRRLLNDGKSTCESLGIAAPYAQLVALPNSETLHNVVVCTLCSCYPRTVLGLQPAWYKSAEYRSRVVREPRLVLAEFGTHIPQEIEVRVHDSSAELRYIVIPERPEGTESWSEERLASLVTRDSMIGVTRDLKKSDS